MLQPNFFQQAESILNQFLFAARNYSGRWEQFCRRNDTEYNDKKLQELLKQLASRGLNPKHNSSADATFVNSLQVLKTQFPHWSNAYWTEQLDYESYWYNTFLLQALQPLLPKLSQNFSTNESCSWLDIGSRNFSYLPALAIILEQVSTAFKFLRRGSITGIELDAFRRYADGYYRWEYALAFQRLVKNFEPTQNILSSFEIGDLMNSAKLASGQKFDCISYILPFVLPYPLVRWGLPLKYFNPAQQLSRIKTLLKPQGVLIWVNLTSAEWHESQKLLRSSQWTLIQNYFYKSPWVSTNFDSPERFISLWQQSTNYDIGKNLL